MPDTPSMIEQVARAICVDEAILDPDKNWPMRADSAKLIISAMRDPSNAMVQAAIKNAEIVGSGDFAATWKAMIDAALSERLPF